MNTVTIGNTEKIKLDYCSEYNNKSSCFQGKNGFISSDDDFEKVYASAITTEELKQRMYKRIDNWKWYEK